MRETRYCCSRDAGDGRVESSTLAGVRSQFINQTDRDWSCNTGSDDMKINALRIICVDDDPINLAHLKTQLGEVGPEFSVRFFTSANLAVEAHRTVPADIAIVDLRMPEANGLETIARMRALRPDAIYILVSGDADLQSALTALNELDVFRFLVKPVAADELKLALDTAVTELNLRRLTLLSTMSHATVERLASPVIYLASDMTVTYVNCAAKEVVERTRTVEISPEGKLRGRSTCETNAFHSFLASVKEGNGDEANAVFRFPSDDGLIPITVSAAFHRGENGVASHFSLVLSDPTRMRATASGIAAALKLLPSEARVVLGLAEGGSVEEAAELAGVSVSTARTYLKNVFQKTGVSRQAELVRLVLLTAA